MKNFILTSLALLLLVGTSLKLSAQHSEHPKNLSWEEKVSPKYSYQLPQKTEVQETNKLNSERRAVNANPYDQLRSQREELKFQIARYEKLEQNEKNKAYLDKYRASLEHVEMQIQDYKAPEKKPKTSN